MVGYDSALNVLKRLLSGNSLFYLSFTKDSFNSMLILNKTLVQLATRVILKSFLVSTFRCDRSLNSICDTRFTE